MAQQPSPHPTTWAAAAARQNFQDSDLTADGHSLLLEAVGHPQPRGGREVDSSGVAVLVAGVVAVA